MELPNALRDQQSQSLPLMRFVEVGVFPGVDPKSLTTTGDKGLVNGLVIDHSNQRIAKIFGTFIDDGNDKPTLSFDDSLRMQHELEDLQLLKYHGVRIPEVIAQGDCFFVMRLLPQDRVNWKDLLQILHQLHTATAQSTTATTITTSRPAAFGFSRDSFYGLRRLKNDWSNDWWAFFVTNRLLPSIEMLEKRRASTLSAGPGDDVLLSSITLSLTRFGRWLADALTMKLPDESCIFPPPVSGSLLHGDVFANNVLHDAKNKSTALIDPVCFYGDPLMDIVKFGNKLGDNEPRGRVYKFYYALDLFAWTRKPEHLEAAEAAAKKLVRATVKRVLVPPPQGKKKHRINNANKTAPRSLWERGFRLKSSSLCMGSSSLTDESSKQVVTLVCFGAFNPPHPNHLSLFEAARSAIRHADGMKEVEFRGFFVPSPDAYLASSSKKTQESQRLPLEHREQLLLRSRGGEDEWSVHTYVCDHGVTIDLLRLVSSPNLFLVAGTDTAEKALEPTHHHIPCSTNVVLVERSGGETDWPKLKELTAKRNGGKVLVARRQEDEAWSSSRIRRDVALWRRFAHDNA